MAATELMSLDEMKAALDVFAPFEGAKLKHTASTSYYTVSYFAFREEDMSILVVYESAHRPPVRFARPVAELFDGRFEIRRA